MGIYYGAVDHQRKKKFLPPGSFADKSPGIYHPNNPFPHMVVMKNIQGYCFEIENDMRWGCALDDSEYKDITEEVFKEYLKIFPEADREPQ